MSKYVIIVLCGLFFIIPSVPGFKHLREKRAPQANWLPHWYNTTINYTTNIGDREHRQAVESTPGIWSINNLSKSMNVNDLNVALTETKHESNAEKLRPHDEKYHNLNSQDNTPPPPLCPPQGENLSQFSRGSPPNNRSPSLHHYDRRLIYNGLQISSNYEGSPSFENHYHPGWYYYGHRQPKDRQTPTPYPDSRFAHERLRTVRDDHLKHKRDHSSGLPSYDSNCPPFGPPPQDRCPGHQAHGPPHYGLQHFGPPPHGPPHRGPPHHLPPPYGPPPYGSPPYGSPPYVSPHHYSPPHGPPHHGPPPHAPPSYAPPPHSPPSHGPPYHGPPHHGPPPHGRYNGETSPYKIGHPTYGSPLYQFGRPHIESQYDKSDSADSSHDYTQNPLSVYNKDIRSVNKKDEQAQSKTTLHTEFNIDPRFSGHDFTKTNSDINTHNSYKSLIAQFQVIPITPEN